MKLPEMTDKDFQPRKPYFGEGVHLVQITGAEAGKSPNTGSEFIEVKLEGVEFEEGSSRLYLTEKTAERTRSILSAITVHNKETEDEKQKVRDAFKKITSTEQMTDQKFLDKFKGMEAWILVEEDQSAPKPNGGFYLRTNLYSYEPKPRKMTPEQLLGATEAKSSTDEIPF